MKVVQGLAIGNLKAYGNPQLIICRRQSKCVLRKPNLMSCYASGMTVQKLLRQSSSSTQNANEDALALSATSMVLLPDASGKIWIFPKDLYCHDPRPEDVFPLPKAKLWKRRQPKHMKGAPRCKCSDPECAHRMRALARTSPLRARASPMRMSPRRAHHCPHAYP